VARGTWAKLILETREGEEEINFFCSPQPRQQQHKQLRPSISRQRKNAQPTRGAGKELREEEKPGGRRKVSILRLETQLQQQT
jgi:hypothetical protein